MDPNEASNLAEINLNQNTTWTTTQTSVNSETKSSISGTILNSDSDSDTISGATEFPDTTHPDLSYTTTESNQHTGITTTTTGENVRSETKDPSVNAAVSITEQPRLTEKLFPGEESLQNTEITATTPKTFTTETPITTENTVPKTGISTTELELPYPSELEKATEELEKDFLELDSGDAPKSTGLILDQKISQVGEK